MTAEDLFPGRAFGALLFDMDGTILDSIASAERVWTAWLLRHGLDPEIVLPTIHGKRATETIGALGLAGIDIRHEADLLLQAEIDDVEGVVAIPGALRFLRSLPADRWSIATSAPIALARRRLAAAGLDTPPMIVTGPDVRNGKPAPDCFLLAAERLGVEPADCLVFEDAPAGIGAAEAAGMEVVVVTATHRHPHGTRHNSIRNYEGLAVERDADGRLRLARRD